jgi:hypothetical protein
VEVQEIRSFIPRLERLLFELIDIWPAWQRDSQGHSKFRPRADSGFVLVLQSAIFSASHA